MSTSKYLPPFTNDERTTVHRGAHLEPDVPVPHERHDPDADATYADFLGDQVDD